MEDEIKSELESSLKLYEGSTLNKSFIERLTKQINDEVFNKLYGFSDSAKYRIKIASRKRKLDIILGDEKSN